MILLFTKVTRIFVAIELLTFFTNAKFYFYCSRELSVFWLNKLYSLSRTGSLKKIQHSSKLNDLPFSVFRVFYGGGGVTKNNILIIHQNNLIYFDLLSFHNYPHFSYFHFIVIIGTMGKQIGRFSNITDQKYPLQHSRNLFYHLQLIIHYMQVI